MFKGLGNLASMMKNASQMGERMKTMGEELLPAAFNQAAAKARELHLDAMRGQMGGLDLPGMEDMLGSLKG